MVDVQNGFVTAHFRHVVPVIEKLAREWIEAGRDVVFTRYLNYEDSPFERIMGWSKLKGLPEIDIVDELKELSRKATAVIDKKVYTLFNDEGAALVAEHGWTDMSSAGSTPRSACSRQPWILSSEVSEHGCSPTPQPAILGPLPTRRVCSWLRK